MDREMLKMKQNRSSQTDYALGKEFQFYQKNNGKSLKAFCKGAIRSDLWFLKKGTMWVEGNQKSKEFQKVVTNQSLEELAN